MATQDPAIRGTINPMVMQEVVTMTTAKIIMAGVIVILVILGLAELAEVMKDHLMELRQAHQDLLRPLLDMTPTE